MTASASKEVAPSASSWPPDELAIARAQQGDSAAQRQLYVSCRQHVYRLAYRMVGAADVDDAVQQSFLQLFRNIKQFARESRFETWLYRLVVNECLQMRRRQMRKQTTPLSHEPMDPHADPERNAEDRDLLERALAKLAPELRAIFLLRETEHLSYAEIAEALEIAEGTVASRLNRARRDLQQFLVDLGWEP